MFLFRNYNRDTYACDKVETVDIEPDCPVCLEPSCVVMKGCNHTLCMKCAHKLNTQRDTTTRRCPCCRFETKYNETQEKRLVAEQAVKLERLTSDLFAAKAERDMMRTQIRELSVRRYFLDRKPGVPDVYVDMRVRNVTTVTMHKYLAELETLKAERIADDARVNKIESMAIASVAATKTLYHVRFMDEYSHRARAVLGVVGVVNEMRGLQTAVDDLYDKMLRPASDDQLVMNNMYNDMMATRKNYANVIRERDERLSVFAAENAELKDQIECLNSENTTLRNRDRYVATALKMMKARNSETTTENAELERQATALKNRVAELELQAAGLRGEITASQNKLRAVLLEFETSTTDNGCEISRLEQLVRDCAAQDAARVQTIADLTQAITTRDAEHIATVASLGRQAVELRSAIATTRAVQQRVVADVGAVIGGLVDSVGDVQCEMDACGKLNARFGFMTEHINTLNRYNEVLKNQQNQMNVQIGDLMAEVSRSKAPKSGSRFRYFFSGSSTKVGPSEHSQPQP